jgi:hypothetical protein
MKKLILFLITSFIAIGCEKQAISESYPEMKAFYTESCTLPAMTIDSVKTFSAKVGNYVTKHPESKSHSLYPKIQENIKSASLRITIECDTTWDGETHINF